MSTRYLKTSKIALTLIMVQSLPPQAVHAADETTHTSSAHNPVLAKKDITTHDDAITIGCNVLLTNNKKIESISFNFKYRSDIVDTVACILKKQKSKHAIHNYPTKRMLDRLLIGSDTAAFPVNAKQVGLNPQAQLSNPIGLEHWFFYTSLNDAVEIKDYKIGVIDGSAQEAWLIENHFTKLDRTHSIVSLFDKLKAGRIKTAMVDQLDTKAVSYDIVRNLKRYFIKFSPLYFAINKNTSSSTPTFLRTFNSHISSCRPASVQISGENKLTILSLIKPIYTSITQSKSFYATIEKHTHDFSEQLDPAEITLLDKQWIREKREGHGELIDTIINRPLSIFLKQQQKLYSHLVNEIIISDINGFNIALSQTTTDFYQGDEEKHLNVFNSQSQSIFVSDVALDDSTNQFITQVSIRIDNHYGRRLGVITLGINAENALNNESLWQHH